MVLGSDSDFDTFEFYHMSIQEIRESGILETFAVGACTPAEESAVLQYLEQYPGLMKDLKEISRALELYAKVQSIDPSPGLKEKVLDKVRSDGQSSRYSPKEDTGSKWFKWAAGILGFTAILLGSLLFLKSNELNVVKEQREADSIKCDSILQENDMQFAILQDLQNRSNEILNFNTTEKYEGIELAFIYNTQTKKNFIQVLNLPKSEPDQSYQLWSLKADQAPIPLTVFQGSEGVFIPVEYEDDTATYAITVEPYGGQDSPTLENLVATVSV